MNEKTETELELAEKQSLVSELPSELKLPPGYEFLAFLGKGSSSTVVQANQMATGRTVAIKIFDKEQADETLRQRFHREAQVLASLEHSHIQKILSFGFISDQTPFIVSEFLEGCTLQEMLGKKGSISLQEFGEIFLGLADACQYLHERQLVHRDIKPANIFILKSEENADSITVAKLIDFGLVKLAESQNNQKLTQTGAIVGTVNYLSPEQCANQAATVQSDIFALGCVMFECLAGKLPWQDAETPMKAMYQRMTEDPACLPENKAPAAIRELIHKTLLRDPEQRCSSKLVNSALASIAQADKFKVEKNSTTSRTAGKTKRTAYAVLGAFVIVALLLFAFNSLHAKKNIAPLRISAGRGNLVRDLLQARELRNQVNLVDRAKDSSKAIVLLEASDKLINGILANEKAARVFKYSALCQLAENYACRFAITGTANFEQKQKECMEKAIEVSKENGKDPVPEAYVAPIMLGDYYKTDLKKAEELYSAAWKQKQIKDKLKQQDEKTAEQLSSFSDMPDIPARDYPNANDYIKFKLGIVKMKQGRDLYQARIYLTDLARNSFDSHMRIVSSYTLYRDALLRHDPSGEKSILQLLNEEEEWMHGAEDADSQRRKASHELNLIVLEYFPTAQQKMVLDAAARSNRLIPKTDDLTNNMSMTRNLIAAFKGRYDVSTLEKQLGELKKQQEQHKKI